MTDPLDIHAAVVVSPAKGPLCDVAQDILAEKAFFKRHPTLIGHDGLNQTCGFVESCMHENDPAARLIQLFCATYDQMSEALTAMAPLHLHLSLPRWVNEIPDLKERFDRDLRSIDFPKISGITPYYGGSTAGIRAFRGAQTAIQGQQPDAVLVGGIDTMVTPTILDARALAGLANTRSNSYGAIPGEAGAILLVQRHQSKPTPPISRIFSVKTAQEPEDITDPKRGLIGKGLKECVVDVLNDTPEHPPCSWLSDYNGDRYRAEELGFVIANLGQPQLQEPICPASSIGDIGAATVPVYASLVPWVEPDPSDGVLITAGDPQGPRGSILCQSLRSA